ncbi:protein phosphatase 2C, putative [Trichomonas vaginalis G3]|uniref:Protein phosphatase 2C, putative n=1 Tax=Trichomonas vaginalis (strain ATCC PRA-98 / G3) TaxID=412133 RepID=A2F8P0_TRIV3|nr:protein phosphatase 2C family [Trichomonas vaginalis G3]EAX98718.1 protein phosphatase 2C, putative [Trichomonas vaginalis G3]KAI5538500.1 protein phosphatase 2C family [Trichomonas vaginalis G3]|eukprot:XP_001311648.1 protein phosphatase 2C [Trichomonas vaginalis G3]
MGIEASAEWATATDKKISARGQGLQYLPKSLLPMSPIKVIDFAGNKIQYLPHDLRSLTALNLSNNSLGDLNPSMIAAIDTYVQLEQLSLENNGLTEFPPSFTQLPLKLLVLSSNKLTKWDFEFNDLQFLGLANNLLTLFAGRMPNLITADLFFNKISVFNLIGEILTTLNIVGNNLTELPDLEFPFLKILLVEMNKLKHLPNLQKFAPKLERLSISDNELEEIPPVPPTLSTLIASNNKISKIDDSLYEISNATEINLSFNLITSIKSFKNEVNFIYLQNNLIENCEEIKCGNTILKNNRLEVIPDFHNIRIFSFEMGFNRIKEIDLSRMPSVLVKLCLPCNCIKEVPKELLKMPLKTLDLSENEIEKIEGLQDTKILSLNLSGNKIREVPELPPSLTIFRISDNLLTELPTLPQLTTLDVSGNRIKKIPDIETLVLLYASRNEIEEVPNLKSTEIIDMSHNNIKTVSDISASFADFSYNNLEEFEVDDDYLMSIKVAHNKNLCLDLDLTIFKRLDCLDIVGIKSAKLILNTQINTKLREIDISNETELIMSNDFPVNKIAMTGKVGYADMQGQRGTMEDALIVDSNIGIYAIFDGHGGHIVSSLSAQRIHERLQSLQNGSEFRELITQAVDSVVGELKEKKVLGGSTMCLVRVGQDKIEVANIGDSRCVAILKDGTQRQLSNDHKPTYRPEVERIREKGSFVSKGRVQGRLAVARAIGDFAVLGIESVIEFTEIDKDIVSRIVIGCDGLYDVVSNEDCLKICNENQSAVTTAYKLRDRAFQRGSTDNISVIVVDCL